MCILVMRILEENELKDMKKFFPIIQNKKIIKKVCLYNHILLMKKLSDKRPIKGLGSNYSWPV